MLDAILTRKCATVKGRITVKSIVAVFVVALAVALPQLVHLVAGSAGGVKWLPMYLPVLLGGCILGWRWGLGIGIMSPIVSFGITSLAGNAMPAATRLPFMIVELAVFAAVSGLFSKKIVKNYAMAFPAVIAAALAGRLLFIVLVAIFQSVSPLSVTMVWAQIQTGFIGLIAQFVIVPSFTILIAYLCNREDKTLAEKAD